MVGGLLLDGLDHILNSFQLRRQWPMRCAERASSTIISRVIAIEELPKEKKLVGNLITDINLEYSGWHLFKNRGDHEDYVRASPTRPPVPNEPGPSSQIAHPRKQRTSCAQLTSSIAILPASYLCIRSTLTPPTCENLRMLRADTRAMERGGQSLSENSSHSDQPRNLQPFRTPELPLTSPSRTPLSSHPNKRPMDASHTNEPLA
ncbi:hypothetical protein PanWU01x14_119550 [Parasponia andersonii]|uniref:Uncharacterized protein n=1 Tax=Parasponia andersonii TaxID=3476 RepID=A0A2P5CVK7_PARAD|nr:hypothetical protein PanWU01x14_119550 [Parasponia andersonii]